jgi:hypothetical protein
MGTSIDLTAEPDGEDLDFYVDGYFLGSIAMDNISEEAAQVLKEGGVVEEKADPSKVIMHCDKCNSTSIEVKLCYRHIDLDDSCYTHKTMAECAKEGITPARGRYLEYKPGTKYRCYKCNFSTIIYDDGTYETYKPMKGL